MSDCAVATAPEPGGEVVLGRHSRLWRAAGADPAVAGRFRAAIGHAELNDFEFLPDDRVWIFSYSRREEGNLELFRTLKAAAVREVVYVSSSSTIVTRVTTCYEYPRVKQRAEAAARAWLDARILTLGLVYEQESELPAGTNVAVSQVALNQFLVNPRWHADSSGRTLLAGIVERPFRSRIEALTYRCYMYLQQLAGSWPCVLRPVDLVLRACGYRWYGYVSLSNRLWTSTTLS